MAPDHVLYATTFSKVFAPGLRLGIAVPPNAGLGDWLVKAKQGTDLHTSSLGQALEAGFPGSWQWSRPDGGMFVWAEGQDV